MLLFVHVMLAAGLQMCSLIHQVEGVRAFPLITVCRSWLVNYNFVSVGARKSDSSQYD